MVAGYSFQIKPFNKIKKVLAKRKVADTEVNYKDEWKRNYFLERISSNIFLITKRLIILENLVREYSDSPPPKNWQIVKYSAYQSKKQTEELETKIVLDFVRIVDLVDNRHLADRLGIENLYYTIYLFHKTLRINPEYDKRVLRELRKGLREQAARLDETVALLNEERTDK